MEIIYKKMWKKNQTVISVKLPVQELRKEAKFAH